METLSNRDLLANPRLALFCSVRCPGKLILKTYDLTRALRDVNVTVIGGFHSPMEQECLRLILRGASPVILCPARSIQGMRVPPTWSEPLARQRMLVASPFPSSERRTTRELAERRNAFVATHADALFIAYASAGGSAERLCSEAVLAGKPVLTFEATETQNLLSLGARPFAGEAADIAATIRDDILSPGKAASRGTSR